MIREQGLAKITQYVHGILDYAVVFSGANQTQTPFYLKTIDNKVIEAWVQIPDQYEQIDKIQIIDADGDIFAECTKQIIRRQGRAYMGIFRFEIVEVTG